MKSLELHNDTNLIDWFHFPFVAMKRYKEYAVGFVILMGAALLVSVDMLSGINAIFAIIIVMFVLPVGFTAFLAKQVTTPVVVYRVDSSGEPCEDIQSWWNTDVMTWPDAFKFDFNGNRILFIDALDPADVKPFDPWIAPPPGRDENGKLPITGTRVASVRSQSKAVTRISKFRPPTRGQQIQQGLMVAVIGGSLIAMFMAGDRVSMIMGFGI